MPKGAKERAALGHSCAGGAYKVSQDLPHPTGLAILETDVPSGAFGEMGMTLYLELDGARFHAQAVTSEAVYSP